MDENLEKFVARAAASLADETFLKLTLSNYKGDDRGLQKVFVRLIDTKQGRRMMFQSRFETRDVVKNFDIAEGVDEIRRLLGSGFRNAHLFTTDADVQLTIGKRNSRLTTGKPSTDSRPPKTHDREKKTIIDPNAFYLKALGIADDNGRIKPSQQDKWRQINKFVEIIAGLVDASPIKDKEELRVVDMGSGKGYLTFAAYDYLANIRHGLSSPPYEGGVSAFFADGVVLSVESDPQGGVQEGGVTENHPDRPQEQRGRPPLLRKEGSFIQMTGIEARRELVELCNDIAKAGGFDGLRFVEGQIADIEPGEIDILIALHACDTATDDALYKGIAAKASIIIAAPCCHKELRKQIRPPEALAGILKHGIMLERTAETITDGLRSLILEREGYTTKLFEFVSTEHTPKNNMLAATLGTTDKAADESARQVEEIMASFGIEDQRLCVAFEMVRTALNSARGQELCNRSA